MAADGEHAAQGQIARRRRRVKAEFLFSNSVSKACIVTPFAR